MRRNQRREVVYVERGDSSAKWLFWGGLLGAAVALLYAPSSGEETRRNLQRKLWKLRAMTEEKLDEISQQFGGDLEEHGFPSRSSKASPREELERRLADARARRRSPADLEEPLA